MCSLDIANNKTKCYNIYRYMVFLGGITEMIDTLTAYKCSFRFLQRNNPLIGEQRNAIKDDKKTRLFLLGIFE